MAFNVEIDKMVFDEEQVKKDLQIIAKNLNEEEISILAKAVKNPILKNIAIKYLNKIK